VSKLFGFPSAFELGMLRERWEDVVGAQLAAHCRPRSLDQGVLVVVAETGAWAAELRFHAATLLSRLQAIVPDLTSLVVRVGAKDGQSW
jgi:predicted nucleic acid-binding Zn ribbon protein